MIIEVEFVCPICPKLLYPGFSACVQYGAHNTYRYIPPPRLASASIRNQAAFLLHVTSFDLTLRVQAVGKHHLQETPFQ